MRTNPKWSAHKSKDGQYLQLRTNRKRTVRGAHKTRDSCNITYEAQDQKTKQLSSLQIPPPKPPPPEMHFIPNPANTEFICLMGLEECVSKILNEDKENSIQPVPFSCSQCGTDFTPTWKWDKAAKG